MRSSVKSNEFKTLCSNETVLENVFVGLHEANLKTTKSNRSYKNMLLIWTIYTMGFKYLGEIK